jgi:hypothetical protein
MCPGMEQAQIFSGRVGGWVSEWVSGFKANLAIFQQYQVNFQWNDDDADRFVLD